MPREVRYGNKLNPTHLDKCKEYIGDTVQGVHWRHNHHDNTKQYNKILLLLSLPWLSKNLVLG